MIIRRVCRVAAIAAAVAAVNLVRPAAAEPVNILGGHINYSRQNQAMFDLTLLNGLMRGEFGSSDSESWDPPHACFDPCTAGSTIDVSLSEDMPMSQDVSVGGFLTYLGNTYFISKLSFTIDADPITLPANFASQGFAGNAQFVLHGLVEAWTRDHSSGQGLSLLGFGKARMQFLSDGTWYSTNYRFENPAAVPEPGTLLLFATGAVAAARRRKRSIPNP